MRRLLAALFLLAAPALAQSPVNVVEHNLSATRPMPSQISNGSAFIVPVLDTTLTARFPAGSTPGDNESNAVAITRSGAFQFVWDGATWDRWTGAVTATQSGTWTVTGAGGTFPVTGTFWQATQPVSGTFWQTTQPVSIAAMPSTPVTGTFWQATQPVSLAASVTVTDGSGAMTVDGTVAATQSGTWTVQPGNTANTVPWLASIHDGTTKAAVLNLAANDPLSVAIVDGAGSQITTFGGGTQYTEADTDASITGTALMWEDAANTLRSASAATPLPVNVVAGGAGDGSILDGVSSAIKATVLDYANSNPLAVRLTDTGGDYVGAGAGTQYADGAVQATPTGTVALGHDGSNVRALTTDAAGDLQVDVATLPAVTGTVTANAGTNLNTSSLLTTTAHDAAFGTAGAADAQVRSVQGIAGGTALPVSGSVTVSDGAGALNVIVDSATLGTVTVSDGAGALNTILDSGTLTSITNAVTVAQATAANLNATVSDGAGALTVDGTVAVSGSVTVTDGAGALNVIVDSGTTTVTQATGTNLHTVVDSGTISISQTTTANDVDVATIAAGDTNIGNVDIVTMPNVTIGTFPDNEPINLAQVAGASVQVANGTAAGSLRVTVASDGTGQLSTVTTVGTVTNLTNLPNEGQQTAANSISVTPDTDNDAIGAPAAAVPGEAVLVGGTDGTNLTVPYIDPCQREARTQYVVDIVTATTTEIANSVASEFFYVCSINLVTAAANNVAIVEDDTDACASPTAGVNGGVTAAEGWNLAANGGLTMGNGQGWVMKTGTAARYFCIITSAATQLSGTITYVSAP